VEALALYNRKYIECVESADILKNRMSLNKLNILANSASHQIYDYIKKCKSYDGPVKMLKESFVMKPNKFLHDVIWQQHINAWPINR